MALDVRLSPKQKLAFNSKADIVIFGGGNGPGKTFTLMMVPLAPEYLKTAGCQSVIFAEDSSKLEQAGGLVSKCLQYYSQAHPSGREGYRQTAPRRWRFPCPGGESTIDLSFIGEPGKWDGMEAAFIGIDQVEQATEQQVFGVLGRNRSTCGARCRSVWTANPPPEGREHWLTKMLTRGGWIGDDGFPILDMAGVIRYYTRHPDTDEFIFADTVAELAATGYLPLDIDGSAIPPSSVTFFPALIDDHPDEKFRRDYKRKLAGLTMFERRRRLEGNWYVTEEAGKYFSAKMFEERFNYEWTPRARRVRSYDNAWSTQEKADWSPGVLESMEPDGAIYICDVIRIRGTFAHVERMVERVAEIDGRDVVIRLPKDAGAAGGLQSALAMRLGAKGYTVVLTADKGDKLTRSKPYQACAERGQIRLAKMHTTQRVALEMLEPFEQYDTSGRLVRIPGLDRSAVSTIDGWQVGFIEEHVRFGRDTVAKKHIKKDTVDAAVGGYEVLTGTEDLAVQPEQLEGSERELESIAGEIFDLFRPPEGGIS